MHTRGWKRNKRFTEIEPNKVKAGDIITCFVHSKGTDGEYNAVRVMTVVEEKDLPLPEDWQKAFNNYRIFPYCMTFACRHVNLNQLDASGGPMFNMVCWPWNTVYRYSARMDRKLRKRRVTDVR